MSEVNEVKTQYKVNPESIALAEWASIRTRRNQLLAVTDSLQIVDNPLNEAQRQEVAIYRQALRDVPQDIGDPFAVVWPEPPAFLK
ncbi:tail fiber assembly protein [Pseudomonas chlororaphis]|uniref:tail fiber assembly protein n=1 Tax=Pseudomonas chlororaphis TaxID=587753 RepID=UPI002367BF38|nr:tail fiber assembly protein [Pseudomonas chlororaphis]WDH36583.1 tail fiber assembly protein [Pseudomonas chlororaphis]WDH42668.1 tail fiber assembly protein [Pseudomonas chlororaphis]